MRHPLHIDATRVQVHAGCLGNALAVTPQGAARRLVPIGAIERVDCTGDVIWSSAALRALGAAGAPVVWRDGRGAVVLLALPPGTRAASPAARLDRAAEHPLWRDRIRDWIASEQSHALLDAARRLGMTAPRLRERSFPVAFAALSAGIRFEGKPWLARQIGGLYRGWMATRCAAEGTGWANLGATAGRPDLARLLLEARAIDLAPLAVRLCADLADPARARLSPHDRAARVIRRFEAETPALEARRHAARVRLDRLVADLCDGEDLWAG